MTVFEYGLCTITVFLCEAQEMVMIDSAQRMNVFLMYFIFIAFNCYDFDSKFGRFWKL